MPKGTFGCQPTPWDWEESLQPDPAASRRDSITEERVERRRVDSLSIRNGKAGVFLFISGEFFRVKGFADSLPDKGDEQEGNHQGGKGGGNHPAGGKIRQSVIEQAPPAGVCVRKAEAQIVQGSQSQNEGGNAERNAGTFLFFARR